jgi:hypothetical protein
MQFVYAPLSYYRAEIRLLEITPSMTSQAPPTYNLHTKVIHKSGHYKALSYCWGSNKCEETILLNGKEFQVTANLAVALQHLQQEPGYYWIDAICINQSDLEERSMQVTRMKAIYNEAAEVVVWFGGRIDLACILPGTITPAQNTRPSRFTERHLSNFLRNGYWRRVWVIQEFAVASTIRILHKDGYISWNDLKLIMSSPSTLELASDQRTNAEVLIGVECIERLIRLRQDFMHGRPISLFDLLLASRSLLATIELDRVYGLLGVAYDSEIFVRNPRYDIDINELYESMAMNLLKRTKNLDVLCFDQGLKDESLPSWAPRWLQLDHVRAEQWISHTIQTRTLPGSLHTTITLPRFQGSTLIARGRRIDVIDGLSTSCYDGASAKEHQDHPTPPVNQHFHPYISDEAISRAILETICSGLSLAESQLRCDQNFWKNYLDIQEQVNSHLADWIAENEKFQIRGNSISYRLNETTSQRNRRYFGYFFSFMALQWGTSDAGSVEDINELQRQRKIARNKLFKAVEDALSLFALLGMRLVVTEQGFIGTTTKHAMQDDVIVELEGCERFVVLRKLKGDGEEWRVIGEAWLSPDDEPPFNYEGMVQRTDYRIV